MSRETISVSALNRYVKLLLESDEVLSQIWVEGEISNLTLHQKSGHIYFSLKDETASVKAVMFRSYAERLRFVPENGMQVVARCKVSLYERDGAFQIYCEDLVPRGVGTAQQQLQALADKLQREGLFAPERKRPLVRYPRVLGVITSATGAALQDILNITARRDPFVTVRVYGVNVQGVFAAKSILRAIAMINDAPDVDEVIISRGGGSKEDLWIFNDEALVRAAATLRVPFISAVGHEIDTTLLDSVSDMRAPTPSAAAELAVPDMAALRALARERYELARQETADRLCAEHEDLAAQKQAFRALTSGYIDKKGESLAAAAKLCRALDPLSVLLRGYSVAMLRGSALTSVRDAAPGDELELLLADGSLSCGVKEVKPK